MPLELYIYTCHTNFPEQLLLYPAHLYPLTDPSTGLTSISLAGDFSATIADLRHVSLVPGPKGKKRSLQRGF